MSPPPAPAVVLDAFGPEIAAGLEEFAGLLADDGVVRGLIGPREVPRLWERHLLNCAALAAAVGRDRTVADVGSGAGLPGLALAIVRPDLRISLVEPLLRRTTFLTEAVAALGLAPRVEVVRARAEELHGARQFDVVTSRAVAPVERLLSWCAPLVVAGGEVVAMKGSSAEDEIAAAGAALARLGCGAVRVDEVEPVVGPPVRLVRVHPGAPEGVPSSVGPRAKQRSTRSGTRSRRRRD